MSGLINKVKDALHSDKDKHNDPRSDNYGHHSTNTGNVVDPRVDSDVSGGRGGNYGAPGGGYGDNTTGGYGAGTTTGYGGSNTAGPHSSNLANKADPRVDSNLDGSRTVGGSGYGSGNTAGGYGSGNTGAYDSTTTGGGYGSTTAGTGYGSSNTAPHNSNLANKLDPRVDSDRDGRNPTSTYGSSTSGGAYTGTTSSGSANVGPHSSNLANKLDPRVDSDRDNRNDPSSRVGGYGTQDNYGVSGANPTPSGGNAGYGNTGYGGTTGTTTGGYGESGYGSGNTHHGTHHGNTGLGGDQYGSSATPGSGNAASTAGPHNSNLLNKLDPRVDSDADGSKTYGGNQTYR